MHTTQDQPDSFKAPKQSTSPWLFVLSAPDHTLVNQRLDLAGQTLGRAADVCLDDPEVSSVHIQVRRRAGALTVEDLDSRNGTWVQGRRLAAGHVTPLELGGVLRLGGTILICGQGEIGRHFNPDVAVPGRAVAAVCATAEIGRIAVARRSDPRHFTHDHLLVLGETGVGKEAVARYAHRLSGCRGPWTPVNCGELSEDLGPALLFGARRGVATGVTEQAGLIAEAAQGTLFLDEIGDLKPAVQVAVLRFLQTGRYRPVGRGEVDARTRIVAATHVDLERAVDHGGYRLDLFRRLAGDAEPVRIPPLRQRLIDLMAWIELLVPGVTLTPGAVEACALYSWPGNLRELRTVIRSSRGAAEHVEARHLPARVQAVRCAARRQASDGQRAADQEPSRAEVIEALTATQGNVSLAARRLRVSRRRLYRLLARFDLDPKTFRADAQPD